jgi:hypothetical protein
LVNEAFYGIVIEKLQEKVWNNWFYCGIVEVQWFMEANNDK